MVFTMLCYAGVDAIHRAFIILFVFYVFCNTLEIVSDKP